MRCLAISQISHIAIHPGILDFPKLVFTPINRKDGDCLNFERAHSDVRAML
jgi:hypothetical protein